MERHKDMNLSSYGRNVSSSVILSLFACASARADLPPTQVETRIELPKYTVTDSQPLPKAEVWRYTAFDGFEVLSKASERTMRRTLEDFRRFGSALELIWPALLQKSQVPVTLILCDNNQFNSFVPDRTKINNSIQGTASLFLNHGSRSALVIDVAGGVLNINADHLAPSIVNSNGIITSGIEINAEEQLKREYVHLLLSRLKPRMPAWFEEGLAQLLCGMQIDDRRIQFAKLEDPNEISFEQAAAMNEAAQNAIDDVSMPVYAPAEDRDFQTALARSALMGFPELFAVQRESALAKNAIGSSWAKQSYAFLHMCLYGSDQRFQKGMLTFIKRLGKEPPSEALFKECFGISYRSMGATLRGYITGAAYRSMDYRALKGEKFFSGQLALVIREATQSEVGRIKGETYLLAGHRDEAQREFVTAYRRGERDPQLLAALGLFEEARGDEVTSTKFLKMAVEQKVSRPEAYLTLAKKHYEEAKAAAGARPFFKTEEVAAISGLLRIAAQQPPVMSEVYELLADTWQRSPLKIDRADATLLVRGSIQFPLRLRLIYQTAGFCADTQQFKEAHALADHGITYAPDLGTRQSFTELKSSLPAPPPQDNAG